MPLRHDSIQATTTTRSTYFSPESARALYGTPTHPRRWHRFTSEETPAGSVIGLELLQTDSPDAPQADLAIAHLRIRHPGPLDVVRAIAGRRDSPPLAPDLTGLFSGHGSLPPAGRPFTITFMTSTGRQPPRPPRAGGVRGWTPVNQWLWALASRSSTTDFPPDPDYTDRLLSAVVVLSADWRGMVTRDGAAFVGTRRDHGATDPFYGYAQLYSHTIYLDALLLGMIQKMMVDSMIDDAARAFEAHDLPGHLAALESRAARFRSVYWLRNAGAHGPANDILTSYQAQHHLADRFDAVLAEISDLNRIVQAQEAQQVSAALGVITVLGLPLGIAFGVLQFLGTHSMWALAAGILAATATTGGLLLTSFGRLLSRTLLRRQPHHRSRHRPTR